MDKRLSCEFVWLSIGVTKPLVESGSREPVVGVPMGKRLCCVCLLCVCGSVLCRACCVVCVVLYVSAVCVCLCVECMCDVCVGIAVVQHESEDVLKRDESFNEV